MAIAVMVIVGGAAIPLAQASVDRTRAAAAAHYVAGRLAMARFEAVRRSAYVAIQFVQQSEGYRIRELRRRQPQRSVRSRYRARHRSPYHRRRTARLSLQRRRIRYSSERHGYRSRSIQHCRSDSNRQFDAAQLQPCRSVDPRDAVSAWPSRQPVRCPGIGRHRADAHPRVQLHRRHMADPVRHERRAAPRVCAFTTQGMERTRLRPGRLAHVIDLSAGGALIETDWRLFPEFGSRCSLASRPLSFALPAESCDVTSPARSRAHPVSRGSDV